MEKIEKIRKATETGDLMKVEFYSDGSGAAFFIRVARTETQMLSLPIEEAMKAVAGFRFKQHELQNCF